MLPPLARHPLAIIAVAIAALLLAACTGDDDPATTATLEATATSEATPTAEPTATLEATPSPAVTPREPTIAPDGRTGIAEVDALIETVLTGDQLAIAALYDGVGHRYCSDPTTGMSEDHDLPAGDWPALLAAGDRSLYSVSVGDPQSGPRREYDIVISVLTDGQLEPWAFALNQGAIVNLKLGCNTLPSSYAPGVSYQYDRFLVLPPADRLPQPPLAHPLNRRTDIPQLNAVLEVIESADPDALLALVDYWTVDCIEDSNSPLDCHGTETDGNAIEVVPQRSCSNKQFFRRADLVATRLPAASAPGTTLHAIATVPDAYRPVPADYSIILVNPGANPYDWETRALYIRDGRIVAWDIGCSENPATLYPPVAYLLPPGTAYDANSGIPAIDTALAAFKSHDVTTLTSAIDWTIQGCLEPGVNLGIGQPPHCEGNEQPGDLIETFTFSSCEGSPSRRPDALETLAELIARPWTVYAISDRGPATLDYETRYQVILAADDSGDVPAISLQFTQSGLNWVWYGCGPTQPQWLLRSANTPNFLLPPPPLG